MVDMPVEDQLHEAQIEIEQLREKLLERENENQNLKHENNFHTIKAMELAEIIAKRGSDETVELLKQKAVQNAELTIQVQELRHHLLQTSDQVESLQSDLRLSNVTVEKLADERKSHQRMLVELGDVVRALGRIEVKFEKSDSLAASNWMAADSSMENIKRKVDAIEEDRQDRIRENKHLQEDIRERVEEINKLQKQNRMLEASDNDRTRLQKENKVLKEECESRGRKIVALEQLFQNLNASRSEDGSVANSIPRNVTCAKNGRPVASANPISPNSESSTDVHLTVTSISKISNEGLDDDSSLEPDESHQSGREISKRKHKTLEKELSITRKYALDLEDQLQSERKRLSRVQQKQGQREGLLRDVIFQYKELQKEHDALTTRLSELEGFRSAENVPNDNPADSTDGEASSVGTTELGCKKGHSRDQDEAILQESSTFEMSDTATYETSSSLTDGHSSQEVSVVTTAAQAAEKRTLNPYTGSCSQSSESSVSMEDYERLKEECARLEHECDDAISRIAYLEEELSCARQENQSSKVAYSENDQSVGWQQKYDEACEETKRLMDELKKADNRADEAQRKQKQREMDLWDVIHQYKQLSDENEDTRAQMKDVTDDHAEWIAKKEARRRDLIFEYKKLEKKHEDSVLEMETLGNDLSRARKEAAKAREDSKTVRKRLNGCNYQYKQLRDLYDEMGSEKNELEKELKRSRKHIGLFKKQEESWTEKLLHIREQRKIVEEDNRRLKWENKDLQGYVKDLLNFASTSFEDL